MENKEKSASTKKIILIALFIALQIICTRFLKIETPSLRVSATFIPMSVCSIIFGPLIGGGAAAIADVIGFFLFPQGSFFPGFTLSAFLSGATYGLLLYKKPKSIKHITIAVLIITIGINLGLDTLWLTILLNKGFLLLLPGRILKSIIMTPIQIVVIYTLWKYISTYVNKELNNAL